MGIPIYGEIFLKWIETIKTDCIIFIKNMVFK